MADGYVQLAVDSTGKKVDVTELTRADASVVERQRVTIGDDESVLQAQTKLLHEILIELRDMKWKLISQMR